jgi:TldD protein
MVDDISARCLNTATVLGATYADVRVVATERESLRVFSGDPRPVIRASSHGFGVRVLVNGGWGFASSCRLGSGEIDRVTALAVAIARASERAGTRGSPLAEAHPIRDAYATMVTRDPFAVPLEEKMDLLLRVDTELRREKTVRVSEASLEHERQRKTFASSLGSEIEQTITHSGAMIRATAAGGGEVQRRSYPSGFARHQIAAGYEAIEALDLVGHAPRIADEAASLLRADPCPDATTSIIIDGSQLCLQLHETCGHAIELDRVLGSELSFAGTSFLTPEKLGTFRYGSELVNITADATVPGGVGTFAYDDEGVPASHTPIVRSGVFVGYLTSRETAAVLGQRSNGTMRAEDWNRIPLVRITNVNLEPGEWSLEDLIADTDDGLLMSTNRSLSIDEKRLNFHFGVEAAWEIHGGKLGRLYKNGTYTGVTPEFWGSCDAICDASEWRMWAIPNCEKGHPSQSIPTGHGTAPARFRRVQIRSSR